DTGRFLEAAQMRLGLANHQTTGDLHLEVFAGLVLKLLPEQDRVALERQGSCCSTAAAFCAGTMVEGKKLRVQAAGIAARCETTREGALEHDDILTSTSKEERRGKSGDAAAADRGRSCRHRTLILVRQRRSLRQQRALVAAPFRLFDGKGRERDRVERHLRRKQTVGVIERLACKLRQSTAAI